MSSYCYKKVNLKFDEKWDIYIVSKTSPQNTYQSQRGKKSNFTVESLIATTLNK